MQIDYNPSGSLFTIQREGEPTRSTGNAEQAAAYIVNAAHVDASDEVLSAARGLVAKAKEQAQTVEIAPSHLGVEAFGEVPVDEPAAEEEASTTPGPGGESGAGEDGGAGAEDDGEGDEEPDEPEDEDEDEEA